MKDNSLLSEIKAARKARKVRLRYYVYFSIIGLMVVATGTVAAYSSWNSKKNSQTKPDTTTTVTTSPLTTDKPKSDTTKTTNPTPKTVVVTPSTPTVDVNALNTKICSSIMSNARATSQTYNKMYFDGWNSWNTTYAGDYDSPDAIAAKEWDKNYIKKLYSDYISQNNSSYLQACGSGPGSIADAMVEPNYDAW